jgi:hypothetical protein
MSTPATQALFAVWGFSASDVYATGYAPNGGLLHYDGSTWSAIAPDGSIFQALWGSSPSDIFAGAYEAVWRWDGSSWSTTTVAPGAYILSLWGFSSSDVYAATAAYPEYSTIVHYDGNAWTEEWNPGPNPTVLYAIWGDSPTDVFAVGTVAGFNEPSLILHYDGSTWSSIANSGDMPLYAVAGTAPNDVFAVGEYAEILHFSGP